MTATTVLWCELAWLGGPDVARGVMVTIDGDRIAAVQPGMPRPPAGAVALAGLTLPGLANTHSHTFQRALRGRGQQGTGSFWTWREAMYALVDRLDPDSLYRIARATYAEMLLAGITGAAGARLVPKLIAAGHDVVGTTRDPNKVAKLQGLGAEPVVLDGLDAAAVNDAVKQSEPEVIISQLTALSDLGTNFRRFDQYFAATNRLRTEGTANLLAAGREVGIRRLVTQGYAGWNNLRQGGAAKTEADPLDPNPVRHSEQSAKAMIAQEAMLADVADVETVVLRYANFYGPGTGISTGPSGTTLQAVRQRKFPIVGQGTGVWSFVHIDDAMEATLLAAGDTPPGVHNIADDEPAPVKEWLPFLCQAIGAKPPMHMPRFVGSLFGGPLLVSMMEDIRGSDNANARRDLAWALRWPTWREGFKNGLAD